MTQLYEQARVINTIDIEDRGRVQVQFLRTDMITEQYIPLVDSFFSKGDNGFDGELQIGDIVVVSFFDYPENQKPFIFGKVKSKKQSNRRNKKETLKIKDHKIVFSEDKMEIDHRLSLSKITINPLNIEVKTSTPTIFTAMRHELMQLHFNLHFHIDSLGYPVLPPPASGYPWNPLISSKDIKIS